VPTHTDTAVAARNPGTRSIPTTSNPTATGTGGVRSIANPSFESFDFAPNWVTWATIAESNMRGWYTTHPLKEEYYDGVKFGSTTHRLIELQKNIPAVGLYHAELNAWVKSMVFQPICLSSGETFSFEFYHTSQPGSRTDIVEFRLGIPLFAPNFGGEYNHKCIARRNLCGIRYRDIPDSCWY